MSRADLLLPMLRLDQYRIARHPAKVKTLTMGRRWGKSTMLGALSLNAARQGARVAWVVPTYKNGNSLWRFTERVVGPLKAAGLAKTNKTERLIDFPTVGGSLGIYSADNPDGIRGDNFNLVAVDEAARVSEETWADVIQPTLADVDGDAILISTPKGKNWFYRQWRDGIQDGQYAASWQAPSSDNPMPTIKRASERVRLRYGETSTTYRQEWGAEFVDDGALVWLREWCEDRYSPADEAMSASVIARFLSYDTAAKDKDTNAYSALVVGELLPDYRMRLRHVWRDRLLFPNLAAQVERDIVRWDADGKLHNIIIEDKSSGTGLYQTLQNSGSERVQQMLVPFMPTGTKETRFEQAGVWVKNGSVILPHPHDSTRWLLAFEDEVFEESEYKDQRDAAAQLILWNEHRLADGYRARIGRAA
jgi:predicted phage terminase large subunit-like protein